MHKTSIRAVLAWQQGNSWIAPLGTTAHKNPRHTLGSRTQNKASNHSQAPPRTAAGIDDFVRARRSDVRKDLAAIREGEGDRVTAEVPEPEHDRGRITKSNCGAPDGSVKSERFALWRGRRYMLQTAQRTR